jgi:hypothetical protein
MKREHRKTLTPKEWERITSGPHRGPVVRRILERRRPGGRAGQSSRRVE